MSVTIHVEDDEAADKISALIEALGYEVHRSGSLTSAREAKIAELGRMLAGPEERAAMRAMLVAANATGTAALLEVSVARAKWLEHCVLTNLGIADRAGLLRRVAGIEVCDLPADKGAA